MTLTTEDVETRLRMSLHATIPQLLSEDTQRSDTTPSDDSTEVSAVLAFTRPDSADSRSAGSRWRLLGAAAAGVILVGGLAIAQRPESDPAPAAQSPISAPASEVPTQPNDEVATTDVVVTTIVVEQPELIAPDAVVCVDAGATEQAVRLCVDELGGTAIRATKDTDDSFAMPINPADASHQADTAAIGDTLNVPVADFDASYLPASLQTDSAATTYLVLGRNDAPYAS